MNELGNRVESMENGSEQIVSLSSFARRQHRTLLRKCFVKHGSSIDRFDRNNAKKSNEIKVVESFIVLSLEETFCDQTTIIISRLKSKTNTHSVRTIE